jgi:hypothetical protein
MFALLHVGHDQAQATARERGAGWGLARLFGLGGRRARDVVAESAEASAPRDELALRGLTDVGLEGPASVHTLAALPPGEGLEAMGLLGARARRPRKAQTLADASPYDVLGYLGLID